MSDPFEIYSEIKIMPDPSSFDFNDHVEIAANRRKQDSICRINGKEYDKDCLNDALNEAIELALKFKRHCVENGFPPDTEIAGVAFDAAWVREKAYLDGKKFEKERIRSLLGV